MRKASVAPVVAPPNTMATPRTRPKIAPAARVRIEPGTKAMVATTYPAEEQRTGGAESGDPVDERRQQRAEATPGQEQDEAGEPKSQESQGQPARPAGRGGARVIVHGGQADRCGVCARPVRDYHARGRSRSRAAEGPAMIVLKRILVPTDFGDASEAALVYAKALADAFSSSLHLLHVTEDLICPTWATDAYAASLPGIYEEIERQGRERLEQVLSPEERERYHAELVQLSGSPFVEIIRYAREVQADLIVLGTHGRGAIAHMLLGSVAERVVRKAPCPVLTVRPAEHEFVMP